MIALLQGTHLLVRLDWCYSRLHPKLGHLLSFPSSRRTSQERVQASNPTKALETLGFLESNQPNRHRSNCSRFGDVGGGGALVCATSSRRSLIVMVYPDENLCFASWDVPRNFDLPWSMIQIREAKASASGISWDVNSTARPDVIRRTSPCRWRRATGSSW